jgi:hypothetical protein
MAGHRSLILVNAQAMRADDKVQFDRCHRNKGRLICAGFTGAAIPFPIECLVVENRLPAHDVETRKQAIPPPRVKRSGPNQLPGTASVAEREHRRSVFVKPK